MIWDLVSKNIILVLVLSKRFCLSKKKKKLDQYEIILEVESNLLGRKP